MTVSESFNLSERLSFFSYGMGIIIASIVLIGGDLTKLWKMLKCVVNINCHMPGWLDWWGL